jgi:hypothetical protein
MALTSNSKSESSIKALSKADEKACAMVLEVTVNVTIRRFANIGIMLDSDVNNLSQTIDQK